MLYNYNYGKLSNQFIEYAPRNIDIDGTWYIPATGEQLESQGGMHVVDTPYPIDGKNYKMSGEVQNNEIVKVGTETTPPPAPEPDPIVDLQEASVDHEYRITLLELGVE